MGTSQPESQNQAASVAVSDAAGSTPANVSSETAGAAHPTIGFKEKIQNLLKRLTSPLLAKFSPQKDGQGLSLATLKNMPKLIRAAVAQLSAKAIKDAFIVRVQKIKGSFTDADPMTRVASAGFLVSTLAVGVLARPAWHVVVDVIRHRNGTKNSAEQVHSQVNSQAHSQASTQKNVRLSAHVSPQAHGIPPAQQNAHGEQRNLASTQKTEVGAQESAVDSMAKVKTLARIDHAVYVGRVTFFQTSMQAEVFAECASEPQAEKLRAQLNRAISVLEKLDLGDRSPASGSDQRQIREKLKNGLISAGLPVEAVYFNVQ